MVDRLAAPRSLNHRVGEPEDQDVLYRLLADVMVDPKNLRLVKDFAHGEAELTGTRQVVPDRLLEHDPSAFPEMPLADPRTIVGKAEGGVPQ